MIDWGSTQTRRYGSILYASVLHNAKVYTVVGRHNTRNLRELATWTNQILDVSKDSQDSRTFPALSMTVI